MKNSLLITLFPFLVMNQCGSHNHEAAVTDPVKEKPVATILKDSISSCVRKKIDSIKKEPAWSPPASVSEFIYNGKHVFLFSANCCDQFNPLYDDSCHIICSPSGGFTGRGDGKCSDFSSEAKFVKLVWKDPR